MVKNNWFSHIIKRIFLRLYLVFQKKINNQFGIEDEQQYQKVCLSICRKLITHQDSAFLIAPISGKKYIKNDKLGIFIIMNERHINVTNHVYNYSVFVSERDWQRISYLFNLTTEKRKQEYEETIKSQITHSLHSILDKINNS
jgi:hypothetical protein